MKATLKMALATGFVGAAALATTAFGQVGTQAQEGTASPKAPTAQAQDRQHPAAQRDGCGRPGNARPQARRIARRLVHSESKVQLREGFGTVVVDAGEITALNDVAKSVTIKRVDGESVTATAAADTRICRDGKPATFAALSVGDHARIVQGDANGEHKVRRIGASSGDAAQPATP